ncbi:hypothetical protein N657DRAFT_646835 [Parathielavia appendiculata]|uniref:Uncharacterized protein n=1 Tax=Parathielavia appendiculata TaxID=2587402 RepID=A0AAN6TWT5_9PEZI|nr:hypothetical protein N657DRAFT_646835 [Parathielavia appendiculata]
MLFSTNITAAAFLLAGIVSGQTPVDFSPEVKDKLEMHFGSRIVETPGAILTRTETARQPTIGTSDARLTGASYLWMMIDLDVSALGSPY